MSDEKETPPPLDIKMGVENGKVVVLFSQRLTIFGLPPDAAEEMGQAMIQHAAEARKLTKT